MASRDVFGAAIQAHAKSGDEGKIIVENNVGDGYEIPLNYLFREFSEMPEIEKKALSECSGSVLEVGAGAGAHASCLKKMGKDIELIDTSEGAVKHLVDEGYNAHCVNYFDFQSHQKFDTILMMMNGIGIVEKVERFEEFFKKAKTLLTENGQIICDSADLSYLYEDENGEIWIDLNANYYGEVEFKMSFKDNETDWFPWLFVDFQTLEYYASENGFTCECLMTDENSQFLARLTQMK
ncbi:MAG: class I SAM-dependent methyltransferase [Crocinitomicaceae bacterium]|nr:class I SAM-dependent methyltransferase [Crocinitomicaceae bacterium]